uniref:RNase H type-1 domain-containing protein n=1 Tax=Fagus sylvatica TaxID=28930 RepID=A0A2N9ED69_FAGSY
MDESIVHLLWNCDLARAIWFGSAWSIHTDCIPIHNPAQIVQNLISPPPEFQINWDLCEEFLLTGAIIIDQLWKYRNSRVHEGSTLCAKKILRNVSVLWLLRDWRGKVVLALSKKVNTTIPLQAEAEAIFWATSIAADQRLNRVCFKSNFKTCMDCLSSPRSDSHWRISSFMSQVCSLTSSHPSWSFKWVCREVNSAPDALASLVS